MTVDEDADYVLVARGVQQDLRRLLLRRLPVGFDLHDDVADELTALAAADRMLISDESGAGAPQQYVSLATLKSYLLDLFDLHDDVPDEMTAAADADRMLISDESADGDPQKWITVENFLSGLMRVKRLPDEIPAFPKAVTTITHNAGWVPQGLGSRLICKQDDLLFSVGNEIIDTAGIWDSNKGILIYDATNTTITVQHDFTNFNTYQKGGVATSGPLNLLRWALGLTIWG